MDVIVLSENLKLFLELLLSFFACIGIVYLTWDFIFLIFKRKTYLRVTAVVDLSKSPSPELQILDLAVFYHTSHAEKIIEKIVIIGAPESFFKNKADLKQVLNIPLEFIERN